MCILPCIYLKRIWNENVCVRFNYVKTEIKVVALLQKIIVSSLAQKFNGAIRVSPSLLKGQDVISKRELEKKLRLVQELPEQG